MTKHITVTMFETPTPNKHQFAEFWPKNKEKMTIEELAIAYGKSPKSIIKPRGQYND